MTLSMQIHVAEPLVSRLSASEVELLLKSCKGIKMVSLVEILTELIQSRDEASCF